MLVPKLNLNQVLVHLDFFFVYHGYKFKIAFYFIMFSSIHPQGTNSADGADVSNEGTNPDDLKPVSTGDEKADYSPNSVRNSEGITTVLASAGHALEGVQAELVFHPLRLAFETKNIKLVESALDCLHVWFLLQKIFILFEYFCSIAGYSISDFYEFDSLFFSLY